MEWIGNWIWKIQCKQKKGEGISNSSNLQALIEIKIWTLSAAFLSIPILSRVSRHSSFGVQVVALQDIWKDISLDFWLKLNSKNLMRVFIRYLYVQFQIHERKTLLLTYCILSIIKTFDLHEISISIKITIISFGF